MRNNRGKFLRDEHARIAWVRFARRAHRPLAL
jgi:hypothetical protein